MCDIRLQLMYFERSAITSDGGITLHPNRGSTLQPGGRVSGLTKRTPDRARLPLAARNDNAARCRYDR